MRKVKIDQNLNEYFEKSLIRDATSILLAGDKQALAVEHWETGVVDFCDAYYAAISIQKEYVHFLFNVMRELFRSEYFLDQKNDSLISQYGSDEALHPKSIWSDGLYYKFSRLNSRFVGTHARMAEMREF
ncbi:MAG: hypothetical protein K9H25_18920 [Rhodospirillum sp.]|nr:hypothetical protein [Rhodospirillum sp.]MCF8491564.1 hypothetical protein [Rhodospirillum sp.]MCF8501953.1 hypothetical protein [Rhodospirillum sp.]